MRVCADKKIILFWCTGRLLPHLSLFSAIFIFSGCYFRQQIALSLQLHADHAEQCPEFYKSIHCLWTLNSSGNKVDILGKQGWDHRMAKCKGDNRQARLSCQYCVRSYRPSVWVCSHSISVFKVAHELVSCVQCYYRQILGYLLVVTSTEALSNSLFISM